MLRCNEILMEIFENFDQPIVKISRCDEILI